MIRKILLPTAVLFMFTACSMKMPTFSMPSFSMPSFFDSEDKDLLSLKEANLCQEIESLD